MTILDEEGRLFGKVNLIDAAVGLFVLMLVPLAYGSWLLFRTPPPVVTGVTPATIRAGSAARNVAVSGHHLRPFVRAYVGTTGATFLFVSPEQAEVQVPELPPGTYDLALFDEAKEINRFPNAITVDAEPKPQRLVSEITAIVRFVTRPEVLDAVKKAMAAPVPPDPPPADGVVSSPAQPAPLPKPTLVSFEVLGELVGSTKPDMIQGRLNIIRAIVRASAAKTADGWQAGSQILRAGAVFRLDAEQYELHGEILSIQVGKTEHR